MVRSNSRLEECVVEKNEHVKRRKAGQMLRDLSIMWCEVLVRKLRYVSWLVKGAEKRHNVDPQIATSHTFGSPHHTSLSDKRRRRATQVCSISAIDFTYWLILIGEAFYVLDFWG